jgi:cytochrome P450
VAYSDFLGWSLLRHADVMRVLHDPATFSNEVSRHVSVPNSMDPPRHTPYRRLIEPYFSEPRMAAFEPTCRAIAAELLDGLRGGADADWMEAFAAPFSVRAQCAFLGWPASMQGMLRDWMRENQAAVFAQDRERLTHLAREFTEAVRDLAYPGTQRAGATVDVTAELAGERVEGRPLHERELVSILRNWTAGEVGTISAAVGILTRYLAEHPELQHRLRREPGRLGDAIGEILRIDGPLVSNRRVTTRPVEFHGRCLPAGAPVTIIWVAANRDGRVFEDPAAFRWDRDPSLNLLYGSGIHVCPGAPLARLELRVAMEEMLARTVNIESGPDRPAQRATYPAGGWSIVPVRIAWR